MANKKSQHIAVIGGGWAGCAAAVTLARGGHQVTLFEAARVLGGRARRVELDERSIDNGQHILLGAYRATLKMMRQVGIKPDRAMLRLPLQMRYPPDSGGMDFVAPKLPAPWHLLFALWRSTGLDRNDKLALARFSSAARWMGWQLNDDCSVSELLTRFDQTERLIQLMWTPLCIAALNTPPQRASAQIFLNVLRDSLGARRAASDMLIPRTDLSQLFPEQAAEYIVRHGGSVICGSSVQGLERAVQSTPSSPPWRIVTNGEQTLVDGVIIATAPEAAAALLTPHADEIDAAAAALAADAATATTTAAEDEVPAPALISMLRNFSYEPITTCYLQYPATLRLPQAMYALQDSAADAAWGQFVFDRGHLTPEHAGLLAVVVSASAQAIEHGHAALCAGTQAQLAKVLPQTATLQPVWNKVISEKRATFSCTPALQRPSHQTGLPQVLLAGDYTAGDYPATLEAAIRSGIAAADLL